MPRYEYSPLICEKNEIRLLTLLPGDLDDDIRFEISHTPLAAPKELPVQRMSLNELRETIPYRLESLRDD
jgi:hypothetical protein